MLQQGNINLPHNYRDEIKSFKKNLMYYICPGSLESNKSIVNKRKIRQLGLG